MIEHHLAYMAPGVKALYDRGTPFTYQELMDSGMKNPHHAWANNNSLGCYRARIPPGSSKAVYNSSAASTYNSVKGFTARIGKGHLNANYRQAAINKAKERGGSHFLYDMMNLDDATKKADFHITVSVPPRIAIKALNEAGDSLDGIVSHNDGYVVSRQALAEQALC